MTWQASPVSMSAKPVSHAGLDSRLATSCPTLRRLSADIWPRARFSRISPVLKADVVNNASGIAYAVVVIGRAPRR